MTDWTPVRLSCPPAHEDDADDRMHSQLLRLVASGSADTRAALVRSTGISRSTLNGHLDSLLRSGLLVESGTAEHTGRGRPAQRLRLAARAGVVLAADLGAHSTRLAVADTAQTILAEQQIPLALEQGPEATLDALTDQLRGLLREADVEPGEVTALAMGLPGPVDARTGSPVRPPIMPGWDRFPVGQVMEERLSCAVLVDNDVNLMALGEARARPADAGPLLFLKIGTGIGGGLVLADGRIHRGSDGAAGDIGHVRIPGGEQTTCQCGNVGCVEAVASASAVLRAVRTELPDLKSIEDLARALNDGEPTVVRHVRAAAETIGEVVAMLVHFYNPQTIALGGLITAAGDDVLAGIRSVVYRRALPLATRNLALTHSKLGRYAGVTGGIVTAVEHTLSPAGIRALKQSRA
ncbi:ROK family transcriptional regulator [Saccharopolyspora oryzae]|uniref:ROK family transcriptional regulator n=1 Tax=Saccharopolyspora oryzae TaxID=2997343 RepID=A0ABT4V8X6_9PSEU|nr:ROK family transcriptional regulator [Saccharopolyspora oryzae]MDA3630411.1 ROK family transcriptional regulator [Saccharopolyspora oryzae]